MLFTATHNIMMFHSNNKYIFLNIFNIIFIMPDVPIVKPINITDYEFTQSKYEHVPKLPFRSIIVASSTGGKTVLIQKLILNVYKNCFSRIFISSPSVHNGPTFVEVKKYQREEMKVDDTKEQVYFDEYRPEELENIIDTQRKKYII